MSRHRSSTRGKGAPERGAILIVLCLLLVPLTIVTATVVDLGVARWQHATLQSATDAAAVSAATELSSTGSGRIDGDGLPQKACLQALAGLRQNVPGFARVDVDQAGGCVGALPTLVSTCVANTMSPVTLTATSGDFTATIQYPMAASTDVASAGVVDVRADGPAADPTSLELRCRAMSVQLTRRDIGPFFARIVDSDGQSVTVRSLGATSVTPP